MSLGKIKTLSIIKVLIFLYCPLFIDKAFSATNPAGNTITSGGLVASPNDAILNNYGTILGGHIFASSRGTNDSVAGMYGSGNLDFVFTNTGNITIDFTNTTTGQASAYGMYVDGAGNHSLTNSGNITATATGGTATAGGDAYAYANAYGMRVSSLSTASHSLTNYGNITATATGGTATAGDNANAYANAYGMRAVTIVAGAVSHNLTNHGSINVSARGGTATAAAAATTASAKAYGMYVFGTPTGAGIINNYGIITATATAGTASGGVNNYMAAHAFEAYGASSYSVGTFATSLRDWSASGVNANTVFGIDQSIFNANQINFRDTTLILRPGTAEQGFEFGKVYHVIDMIAVVTAPLTGTVRAAVPAEVTGTISAAVAEVPFLTATLTNGHDPLNATVKLDTNISDETVPGATSAVQGVTLVQGQMSNITRQLLQANYNTIYAGLITETGSSSGSSLNDENRWTAFLNPYFNFTDNNKYNFDANSVGITGGASYNITDSFSFGAHLDFNSSNYDADMMNMKSSATSFALGLHANLNIMPEWYISAQATSAISQTTNNYEIRGLTSLYSDSSYNSESLYLALNSGYVLQIADGFTITPEIGLSYLTTHSHAYDINWSIFGTPVAGYTMSYDDLYYSNLFGHIKLNARGEFDFTDNSDLAFNVGFGVRQNLTANDIESSFDMLGNRYTTRSTEDTTTFITNAGIELNVYDVTVSLNYSGDYGYHQSVHGGDLAISFEF